MRAWTGFIWLPIGEMVGWVFMNVISGQDSNRMLHLGATVQMFRFLVAQIGARGRRRGIGAGFCVSLSSPSYAAFRQQSTMTYHSLTMHVITLSTKHVITFSIFSGALHLFLGTGLAIE